MSDDTRPSPLVPAEVDLRDFSFMPLEVQRLRDSELAGASNAEVFRCSVLSWCIAWHQMPAGSLPDDDVLLARLLGFGRDVKAWRKVRAAGGLRGWVLCDDGRLYHPVVASKARESWDGKLAQRWRTECGRIKKHNQRHKLDGADAVPYPDFEEWKSQGCPHGQALAVPGTRVACPQGHASNVPGETASKGQGEGQGQGQGQGEYIEHPPKPPRKRGGSTPSKTLGRDDLVAEGVEQGHAADWLAVRKAKHAPLTATAWDAVKREANLAAMTPGQAVQVAAERGWQGFKASWLKAEPAVVKANGSDPFAGAR